MKKRTLYLAALVFWLWFPAPSLACSVFYSANDSLVLAAKNLDSDDPHTKITFMARYEGGYGWMFFSKSNELPGLSL